MIRILTMDTLAVSPRLTVLLVGAFAVAWVALMAAWIVLARERWR